MRRALAALALLLVLPLQACFFGDLHYRAETTLLQEADHVAGSALEIRTRNGAVDVAAAPQQSGVSIEARLRAGGRNQAEADDRLAAARLDVSRVAGALVIAPVFPDPQRSGDGASLTVRLPDADGVSIGTGNGSVIVAGLAGNLEIRTSNGPIRVTGHRGQARIDTSNGSVRVREHVGAVYADTSNGSVEIEGVDGAVTADTSNGHIEVTLGPDDPGPLHLDTSNGSITVHVGPGFAGAVSLDTSNGSITVRDETGRIRSQTLSSSRGQLVIGEGGAPSRLDTSNGRITMTVASNPAS